MFVLLFSYILVFNLNRLRKESNYDEHSLRIQIVRLIHNYNYYHGVQHYASVLKINHVVASDVYILLNMIVLSHFT